MDNYILNDLNLKNNYQFNYYQYKKTITQKNNFSFTIIFLLIIFLTAACVIIAPKRKVVNEFFYVEIDNFQTYNEAISLSSELQKSGTGSYIFFDKSYHVLVSFYSSKNDAEKVCENIKNSHPNSQVFSINFPQFYHQKSLKKSQNLAIENLLNLTKKIISQLEHLSNNFDRQTISYAEVNNSIKNYLDDYTSTYEELLENFKTNSKFNKVKEYSEEIQTSLQSLTKKEADKLSVSLRYELISITIKLTQISCSF